MGIRYGFNYHTDENISNLAMMIVQKVNKLKPDYLEIDGLAQFTFSHQSSKAMPTLIGYSTSYLKCSTHWRCHSKNGI